MAKNFNSSKSNTSKVDDGGGGPDDMDISGTKTDVGGHLIVESTGTNQDVAGHLIIESSGTRQDVEGSEKSGAVDHNSTRSNRGASVGEGGGGTGVIGSTFGLAKTILMAAVLLTAVGVGFDLYQTYNDAIDLNLEDHVTEADFALNDDKTEINGDIGFNIPEMGMFEKKIMAQVHVTVLGSNPTTNGDYSFEYTLGSGEQTYEFSLTDLDPVTVAKIDAGEDLDLEYTTSITVIYLGIELAPATTDMPARIVTVETA